MNISVVEKDSIQKLWGYTRIVIRRIGALTVNEELVIECGNDIEARRMNFRIRAACGRKSMRISIRHRDPRTICVSLREAK